MQEDKPLFVRLPATEADKLHRAAQMLRLSKKDVVAALVARHVDPQKLDDLRRVMVEVGGDGLTVGRADFRPAEPPEVMTVAQAAELLQLEPEAVAELAEAGELPGRRVGEDWRFSRSAVLAWLAGD